MRRTSLLCRRSSGVPVALHAQTRLPAEEGARIALQQPLKQNTYVFESVDILQ
jgi:hypothetical protein